jgi:hypothetical protein
MFEAIKHISISEARGGYSVISDTGGSGKLRCAGKLR